MNGLALCSGVGMLDEGFGLGLEHFGITYRTICHVERDAYAAACLVARMEDAALAPAPIWDDLTTFDGRAWRGKVDYLTAGFPCQPWSVAGARRGTDDERWLWPDIARIIRDAEPALVLLENVPGLISGGGLHFVLDELAEMGFDAEWCHLSAAAVGASHRRERFFLLAYRPSGGFAKLRQSSGSGGQSDRRDVAVGDAEHGSRRGRESRRRTEQGIVAAGSGAGVANTDAARTHEPQAGGGGSPRGTVAASSRAMVNPESERVKNAEVERSCKSQGIQQLDGRSRDLADADGSRQQERPSESSNAGSQQSTTERSCGIFAPGPSDFDGWGRVVADGSFDYRAPAVKPGVRVLVDGLALVVDASRADQLRCTGNGVVALQAAVATVVLGRRLGIDRSWRIG